MGIVSSDQSYSNIVRILDLPDATLPQQPATLKQVLALSENLPFKDDVRVSAQGNINLATPGAVIDSVTLATNDRLLLRFQTAPAENGIYIFNGAAAPLTRAPDANTGDELKSAVVPVNGGTDAGTQWRQTAVAPVLGTTAITFVSFAANTPDASTTVKGKVQTATQAEVDAGTDPLKYVTPQTLTNYGLRVKKFSAPIGDGTATSFTLNHNFNTRDVRVEVYRLSTPWDTILVDVNRPSVNSIQIAFATGNAPATNAFQVVVLA